MNDNNVPIKGKIWEKSLQAEETAGAKAMGRNKCGGFESRVGKKYGEGGVCRGLSRGDQPIGSYLAGLGSEFSFRAYEEF